MRYCRNSQTIDLPLVPPLAVTRSGHAVNNHINHHDGGVILLSCYEYSHVQTFLLASALVMLYNYTQGSIFQLQSLKPYRHARNVHYPLHTAITTAKETVEKRRNKSASFSNRNTGAHSSMPAMICVVMRPNIF